MVAGQQFEYAFDSIGNRTETSVGADEAGSNLRTAIYEANGVNQLTEREVPGYAEIIGMADDRSLVQVNGEAAYRRGEYFRKELAIDNSAAAVYQGITNESIFGGFTTTVTGNVYIAKTPEMFLYDGDGNLTNDGRWTFRWDAENRLTNIASYASAPVSSKRSLNLTYDYRGRRIQKAVSTNNGSIYVTQYTRRFIYDGWNLIAELDGSNNLLQSYVWGTDLSGSMQGAGGVGGLLSMTVHSGAEAGTYFYSYDGNGNVTALVNSTTGEIAAQYEYGPFGELIRGTGLMAFTNPFRFSTKYTDDETDLLYYGYRYYNPSTGRWLSRDPIEEEGGLNLYAFNLNDGVNAIDPDGLQSNFGINPLGKLLLRRAESIKELQRQWWFDQVVKHGGFKERLPKEFLRHYIWEKGPFFDLSVDDFLQEVKPDGSIYNPNKWAAAGQFEEELKADIKANSAGGTFEKTYRFGIFDAGHTTGGLGRSTMIADVKVCVAEDGHWYLSGTATMVDDPWDFDWKWAKLLLEQRNKFDRFGRDVFSRRYDLMGRETRTSLGSLIPGKDFAVRLSGPVKINEKKGDESALFSK